MKIQITQVFERDNFLNNEYLLHNFENYGKKYYKIFATQDIIKKTINCNAKKN